MVKVYWTDEDDVSHGHPYADLSAVLIVTKNLRTAGMRFVTMVSEDPNCVGKMGVRRQDPRWSAIFLGKTSESSLKRLDFDPDLRYNSHIAANDRVSC